MTEGGSEVLPDVSTKISANDFYRPEHKMIYSAILRQGDAGVEYNILTIEEDLQAAGELVKITHTYLFGLLQLEYTTARATYYADKIREAARLRRLDELGREISDEAKNERSNSIELGARFIEKLTAEIDETPGESFKAVCERVFESFAEMWRRREVIRGMPTGYESLDRVTGGLKKSDLIILAARPSMGKSVLAINMAYNTARLGNPVYFFSLEMSKEQLVERLLSNVSGVELNKMRDGQRMHTDEGAQGRVLDATDELSQLPLTLDDTGGSTLYEIKSRARRAVRNGAKVIMIDHLQLIQGTKEYKGNRVQEVSEISRQLKALARELNCPVMILSQLSRQVEMRGDKRPQLSDLRDSGAIEQDADVVMMLYREKYYDAEAESRYCGEGEEIMEVHVAKNRNGQTKKINLRYVPALQRCEGIYIRD